MSNYYDYTIKTLIVGDSGVGKSSIMDQFVEEKYSDSYQCTIGVDYKTNYIDISKKSVKFLLWDTAGQERFNSITKIYYRGAQIIIYVFDITDRISFENIPNWIKETETTIPDTCAKVLVGNKCDCDCDKNQINLEKMREVSSKEAEQFAKLNKFIGYYETSAKKNINIEKCFLEIGNYHIQNNLNNSNNSNNSNVSFNIGKKSSKKSRFTYIDYKTICFC
jgi:small GTP-binding protein